MSRNKIVDIESNSDTDHVSETDLESDVEPLNDIPCTSTSSCEEKILIKSNELTNKRKRSDEDELIEIEKPRPIKKKKTLLSSLLEAIEEDNSINFDCMDIKHLDLEDWKEVAKKVVKRGIPDLFLTKVIDYSQNLDSFAAARYVASQAAKQGCLDILLQLKASNKLLDFRTGELMWKWVAFGGHNDIMSWALEMKYPFHPQTGEYAVKGKKPLETLKWLHEHGYRIHANKVYNEARIYDRNDVKVWLKDNFAQWFY